ncbi:hypothetical protein M0805_006289 [Coniferiporia weirii]|nr:hypothetical protein M0805_006289 [Coniferiporia weirii]
MLFDASRTFARGLSSSDQSRLQDSIKDPTHPSLYYHLFDVEELAQPVFCLSFLDIRPRNMNSRTILGWLPVLSQGAEGDENASGLNDFVENKSFTSLLHEAIQKGLMDDEIWKNGAIQTQSGWMHVFDQRNPPPLGRIPDADDILASVRVEDGRMLIESYQPMPSYRLCTGDGVCQLTDGLFDQLKLMLERVVDEEKEGS